MGLCHSKVHSDRIDTHNNIIDIDNNSKSNKKYNKRYDIFKNLNEKINKLIDIVSNDELENLVLIQTNPQIAKINIRKYSDDKISSIIFTLDNGNKFKINMSPNNMFKGENSVLNISYDRNILFYPQSGISLYNFMSKQSDFILLNYDILHNDFEYFVV